jgi:hypothetical protein
MKDYQKYINALRKCAKEHENELVSFAHIRTTDLCNDTADLLEKLETESDNAIPIPEGATNGDVIKAMFPDALKSNYIESGLDMKDYVTIYIGDYEMRVAYDWWYTPYTKGVE